MPDVDAFEITLERIDTLMYCVLRRIEELQASDLGPVVQSSGLMWAAGLTHYFMTQLETRAIEGRSLCKDLRILVKQHTEEIEKLHMEQETFRQKTKDATVVAGNLDKERERICNDQEKVDYSINGLINAEKAVSSNVRYSILNIDKANLVE